MAEAEEEYVSLSDLAKEMGLKRTSLYYYLSELHIKRHKFPLNKNTYVTRADAERARAVKKAPWTVAKEEPAKDAA